MQGGLFIETPTPRTSYYMSPGDLPKRKARKRDPTIPPRQREPKPEKKRPNPFRQPIADEQETFFRHQNWQHERDLIRRHLLATGLSRAPLDRWDNCGAECLVEWSDTADRYRLRASYCKNRHCRPCAKAKAGLIAANLKDHLAKGPADKRDRFRFITLTLRNQMDDLIGMIERLQKCFTRLRQTAFWKKSQVGGVAMIEVTWSKAAGWHAHLHVIGEGDFLRQSTLSDEWHRITGDSYKVTVQSIDSAKDAVHYVTKYISKGTIDAVWENDDAAQEWIIASRGLRTAATYGTWRGFRLMQHQAIHDLQDWRPVGLLAAICRSAYAGCIADQLLLIKLEDSLQYDPHKQRRKTSTDIPTDSG